MIKRDKEGHYIMIMIIYQEAITIENIYVANTGAPKCIKHKLTELKGEIKSNTTISGDSNIPLSTMDRSPRESIRKQQI